MQTVIKNGERESDGTAHQAGSGADLDWPLNASSLLSASAELLVEYVMYFLLLFLYFNLYILM